MPVADASHYCGVPQTAMLTGPIPPNVKGLPETGLRAPVDASRVYAEMLFEDATALVA